MERQGIVRPRPRDGDLAQVEWRTRIPALWWLGAVLWVALWPLVISTKYVGGWLTWLPWWLPLALAPAHMALLAWPVWQSERLARQDELKQRFGRVQSLAQMLALEPGEFEGWTGMLFQLMGYGVVNTRDVADHGIDLIVSNERVRCGLVQCKRYRATLGESTVRELYGTMIHENADYGWLITTGGVSRQALEWANGKPIELWDGQMLVAKARRLRSH
jgi:hypothetical protein